MVGLIDDYFKKFPIKSRIKLYEDYGTVKYVGEVQGYPGIWLGIEWDEPTRGKHNGAVKDIQYFQTDHPTSGSMIRPGKLKNFESVEIAAKDRYLTNTNTENPLDESLMRETQQHLHASVFEIVGMEKLARKQSKIEELIEIDVSYSTVIHSGDLSEFKNLNTLNLISTLVWNWEIVAQIVSQIPKLMNINLSSNRLVSPTEEEIIELEPKFRQLKHINLGKCEFKDWKTITNTARLWPNLESLGIQRNYINKINFVDFSKIFKNLRNLDLHLTNLSDFNEILKLGSITTLKSLLLMENDIKDIQFPDCDFNKKLDIFPNLESLNLSHNPISDESRIFNELDKLPSLISLCKSPNKKTGYEEMFSKAAVLISNLQTLNKVKIGKEEKRGAEYDIWKKHGLEWQQTKDNKEKRNEFCKQYRSYSNLVKKYGSPEEFVMPPLKKVSNLVKLKIKNKETGEIWEKKVPRKISVQTLQGLIIKQFKLEHTIPKMSYIDANHTNLIVELDNLSRNLDFYSIQDNDTVIVEW